MTWRGRIVDLVNRGLAPLGAELRGRDVPGDNLWRRDPDFVGGYERVRARTMMTPQRLYLVWQVARRAAALSEPGDSAEVGAWRGGASLLLAELAAPRTHFVLDTFTGLPEADADCLPRGSFAAPVDEVRAFLGPRANAVILPGLFPDTAAPLRERRFSFVHLDVDLYAGTRAGLELFLPRLVPGGAIVVDDYGSRHSGVTNAVDEACADAPARRLILNGQCVVFGG